jgi:hypothetical protein
MNEHAISTLSCLRVIRCACVFVCLGSAGVCVEVSECAYIEICVCMCVCVCRPFSVASVVGQKGEEQPITKHGSNVFTCVVAAKGEIKKEKKTEPSR